MKKKSKILAISPQLLVALIMLFLTISAAGAEIGLVGHWKIEDNWNDSSGNENDGTGQGGVGFADGKVGRCGSFDGVNDYVNCGSMSFGTTLTFEAWIKLTAKTGGWRYNQGIISPYAGPGSGIPLLLEADEEGNSLNFYDGDGVSATFNLVGEWHHVAVTRDGVNKTTGVCT